MNHSSAMLSSCATPVRDHPTPSSPGHPSPAVPVARVPDIRSTPLRFVLALPAHALLAAIWVYQRTLSPVLPVVLGPSCGCRFAPTCSHYAADAVRVHGAFVGTWLTLRRLVKCTPLHPGGFDPVPPRAAPRCVRLTGSQPLHPTPGLTSLFHG